MFSNAIVRIPGRSMVHGLSSSNLGKPDYKKALVQHQSYIQTLKDCGLKVTVLEPDEDYPDSTFVEDVALLTLHCAIIMNPGAPSRKGETSHMEAVLSQFYSSVEKIMDPGTVDAGDIMMVGKHFYIGLSNRTNINGAKQVIDILNKYSMSGSTLKIENFLHLKSGLAYLENNNMVVCGEFKDKAEFSNFNKIEIPENERYAANCIWINGTIIIPKDYPVTKRLISALDYSIIELDMTEFQKLDGGLSCLSLRF